MSKELKEGSWESRGAQKARREHGLRNLAAKVSRCENHPPRCEMVSQPPSAFYKNFRSYEEVHWHTSAILQARTPVSQLRNGCEFSTLRDLPFRSRGAILKGVSQLWNHPLAHECHFATPYTHFAAAKWLWNPPCLKILQRTHHEATPPFRLSPDSYSWSLLRTSFLRVASLRNTYHCKNSSPITMYQSHGEDKHW